MSEISLTTVIDLVNANIIAPPMDGNHGEAHPKSEDYVSDGIPFIMASDLVSGHVDFQKCKFIQKNLADTLRKGFAYPDDVLLSHKATIGRTAIIQKNPYPYVMLTPQVTFYRVIDKTKLLPHFLRYYFETKDFQDVFSAWAGGGSTRSYLGITAQLKLPIFIPPLHTQTAISSILGSLDNKIDLNRMMNETLEAMARALFRDWFVDFGPTRAKMAGKTPYLAPELWELFPDRLDDEGKPERWELRQLHNILEFNYGKSLPTQKRIKGEIPVYGSGGVTGLHNEALVTTPTIIVGRKGTVGALYWENRTCFPIDTVFYVTSKSPLSYCFYLLETLGLENMNTDAAVPGLNRDNAYRLEVFYPPAVLIRSFANIVENWRNKIIINESESRTLAQLRDLLLPKLMSGEISIRDAEKMVEDVA